ncbi:hypothetical protein BABINDRAFT_159197 [Babjeviella inositovora NRRL Y-12698]|uniref:BZIP domain-containing protein n=1 Tax=Babjeviella inositovora NRRL Y-12698 TaxID=984486 RepID=A0A1E3QYN1_9ASCO|nr:uncharacterized protein BABINDRAFT_159197 [Babjeviella inositovora NRRL Y-12698]ODQ82664.1 hypothetical protein BABINDRAFT_159197 [Babjeviella inositovora NRRL Y-12698]
MSYQSIDYLANLNLEFADSFGSPNPVTGQTDLALFTDANFFDFEVSSDGFEQKPVFASPTGASAAETQFIQQQQVTMNLEKELLNLSSYQPVSVKLEEEYDSFPQGMLPPAAVTTEVHASETDKRRRNTAASARFRVKKKIREQEIEKQSQALAEKVRFLELRVKTLEMENKCLKSLIVEKNEKKNNQLVEDIKRRSGL